MKATRQDAMKLLMDGSIALAAAEANGIRIDTAYLSKTAEDLTDRIKEISDRMRSDPIFRTWRKRFGAKTNMGSREQLGTILFDVMKLPGGELTEKSKQPGKKNRWKVDDEILSDIESDFVRDFQLVEKLKKLKSGHVSGIQREVRDGLLHPFFPLHLVISFRGSSSDPNFQNIPLRDPELGKIIRPAFIPRKNHLLIEFDLKGAEVTTGANVTCDPRLMEYVSDSSKDMHRDVAAQCYMLKKKEISKAIRQSAKGDFVFAEFYGAWYKSCAVKMWKTASELNLENGQTLREHLESKGIVELGDLESKEPPAKGTFGAHIRSVEHDFWGRRFKVYAEWKEHIFEKYLKRGYFDMVTGFRCTGVYNKREVCNYPIQGCLAGSVRVQTDRGMIPIRELVGIQCKVWTGFKWANATAVDRGECQRAIITLSSGLKIKCDIRHKLKDENDEWVKFKDLKIGSYVALPKCGESLQPSESMNWWFIFGFLIGDGYFGTQPNRGRKYVSITGGKLKKPILRQIRKFLIAAGYSASGYRSVRWRMIPAVGNKRRKFELKLEDKRFASFLETHGFKFGCRAATKRVPESVWRTSPQAQRDFLEGLWLSDGGRLNRRLNMRNIPLLLEVQQLAATLGFDSVLTNHPDGLGGWLKFTNKRFNSKTTRKYPRKAIERYVRKVQQENYDDQCQFITDKRNFKSGNDITQNVAERLIEKNSTGSQLYRYDRIVSIKILNKTETTYTMSVDDPLHQFSAGGVIHKNSSFHCLLWSLIRMHRWLIKHKMRSLIVGQIHDSILMDVYKREVQVVTAKMKQIVSEELTATWKWIQIPLVIEVEATDTNWYEKKPLEELLAI